MRVKQSHLVFSFLTRNLKLATCNKTTEGSLKMYKYEVIVWWSEKDQAYIAEAPELPGCMSDGKTYKEAVKPRLKERIFNGVEYV